MNTTNTNQRITAAAVRSNLARTREIHGRNHTGALTSNGNRIARIPYSRPISRIKPSTVGCK